MAIEFDYNTFHSFYSELGEVTTEVKVHEYTADYSAMKYDKTGTVQPFCYRSFVTRKVPRNHPVISLHPRRFPHGCFVIFPEQHKPQKPLYIITPTLQTVRNTGEIILTGDHYSFVVNKNSVPQKALNFHRTEYTPSQDTAQKGRVYHYFSPLPRQFRLTPASLKLLLTDALESSADFLYTLFSQPWGELHTHTGGTSYQSIRRRRTATHHQRRFSDIWRSLPIHKMTVICMRVPPGITGTEQMMHVTVIAHDRLHHTTTWRVARHLQLPVANMNDVPKLEAAIARAFEGMQWDDFREAPEPEFPWG